MRLSEGTVRYLQVFKRRSDIWEFHPLGFIIEAFIVESKTGLVREGEG